MATFATKRIVHCNAALDAVALLTPPNNACAKQKKHLRQRMWKPKALTICNTCTRICELNNQLLSHPNQTGVLPEDELKSAFIDICMPDWQQEFVKTGIDERSSAWEEILTKAEAMESAEIANAERAPAREKRDFEDGEVTPTSKPPPKKKKKPTFFCRSHGADHDSLAKLDHFMHRISLLQWNCVHQRQF